MGAELSRDLQSYNVGHLRGLPDAKKESKYDPLFGFPRGRKERVSIATEAEMESAQLPDNLRDYCAHWAIKWHACIRDNIPFVRACKYYKDSWNDCQYNDQVLRMKEYEREKRLDARQARIRKAQAAEEIA